MKLETRVAAWVAAVTMIMPLVASAADTEPSLGPKDGAGLTPAELDRVQVGEQAPDFTLEDQDGEPVTLSELRGEQTVVLVFYRGHW